MVIDENHNVEYRMGNIIKELEKITLDDYMKIFNNYREPSISYLKELEATVTMTDVDTTMINTLGGEEYSISYKIIEEDNKLVLFGMPYSSIYKYNRFDWKTQGKNQIAIVIIIDILILMILVYIFAKQTAKKFIKPIEILKAGMNDITNGNYGNQLELKRDNEFKELADGFNLMSKTIKEEKEENERLQQERNKLILYISHDLKNPLAAVLGYSEILSQNEKLNDKEKLEYLNIITKNSKRANKIITDLFDLSLLESSDYKLKTKEIDINEALREIVADYIPELENKEFKYDFHISEEKYLVQLDEAKFTRAISNLIDNSIKYNEKNIILTIESKNVNDYIEIVISDNGKGISNEARGNIFDAFIRDDKARNSATGGTGIGLSITKAIIEKHGGTIELIDSNAGVSFRITIKIK